MLGFGPIAGTGNTISGSVQWINPLDDLAFITSDVWQLARYIGQRSSVSGFPARPLYKPELCMSSKSLVSSKILTEGRLLGKRPDGRPVYKVNASYYYNPSLGIPPAPTSEYTWGRLVGSRSSFTSNTSLISGRLLYAARPPCKENQTPSSYSSVSSSHATSFFSSLLGGCCPDRYIWPNRLRLRFVRTAGVCTFLDVLDNQVMVWGFNPWLTGNAWHGWGWYGTAPGGGLVGIPEIQCTFNAATNHWFLSMAWGFNNFTGPGGCDIGTGGIGGMFFQWDLGTTFSPTAICPGGIWPLTGTYTYQQGATFVASICCGDFGVNTYDITVTVEPEP